jgi:hypothetical protein
MPTDTTTHTKNLKAACRFLYQHRHNPAAHLQQYIKILRQQHPQAGPRTIKYLLQSWGFSAAQLDMPENATMIQATPATTIRALASAPNPASKQQPEHPTTTANITCP